MKWKPGPKGPQNGKILKTLPQRKRDSVDVRPIIRLRRCSVKENTAQKRILERISKKPGNNSGEIQSLYKKQAEDFPEKREKET